MAARGDRSAAMTERAVAIAGGGPSGLMLACALALAGVDAAIVERRASQELDSSHSGGLHSRTIEVLDQHGIADRFHQQHAAGRHAVEPHKQGTGEEQRDELDGEDGGGRHQRLDSSFFGEMVGQVSLRLRQRHVQGELHGVVISVRPMVLKEPGESDLFGKPKSTSWSTKTAATSTSALGHPPSGGASACEP